MNTVPALVAVVLAAVSAWLAVGPIPAERVPCGRGRSDAGPTRRNRSGGAGAAARARGIFGSRPSSNGTGDVGIRTPGTSTHTTMPASIPAARNPHATGSAISLGEADAALLLELCAALLAAGLPLPRILDELAEHVPGCTPLRRVVRSLELSMSWERAWAGQSPVLRRVGDALAFTHLTGAPSAAVLRSSAALERRAELRRAERRAAELGVRLVVPLGLCALPAFICLGIVPVVISLLPRLG